MTEWIQTDDLIEGDVGYYAKGKAYGRLQVESLHSEGSVFCYLLACNLPRHDFCIPMPPYDLFPDGDDFSYRVLEHEFACGKLSGMAWCEDMDDMVARCLELL